MTKSRKNDCTKVENEKKDATVAKRDTSLYRYILSSPREPLGRVAPCIEAMIQKIDVAKHCVMSYADELRDDIDSDGLDGVERILNEAESELHQAAKTVRKRLRELSK